MKPRALTKNPVFLYFSSLTDSWKGFIENIKEEPGYKFTT